MVPVAPCPNCRGRGQPVRPAAEYTLLRKESPISRFVWPNGVEGGW